MPKTHREAHELAADYSWHGKYANLRDGSYWYWRGWEEELGGIPVEDDRWDEITNDVCRPAYEMGKADAKGQRDGLD